MRHCFLNRKSLAAAAVFAMALALPAIAAELSLDAWREFGFTGANTPASGCDPADLAGGITPNPNVFDLSPLVNANRLRLKVRSVKAWDAIKAHEQFGIRAPISPLDKITPDVAAGRALFIAANCQQCHGGTQWTSGLVRFPSPPDPSLHNGAANSLADVLGNVQHRSAGTAGVDTLASPSDRAKLVQFVLSIDAATVPIPPQ